MPATPALSEINRRRVSSRPTHKGRGSTGPLFSGAFLNGYVTHLFHIGNVYVRGDARVKSRSA